MSWEMLSVEYASLKQTSSFYLLPAQSSLITTPITAQSV